MQFDRLKRREFITLLGGAATTWPLATRAQQMPVIGYLGTGSPESDAARVNAVRVGLKEAGYVEGHNVAIEFRWGQGQNDRLPALVADLVRRQVAVILTLGSTPATLAAKEATTTIPVVFSVGVDPVAAGLVASMNRPGGNITGVSFLTSLLGPKLLELLHETVPTALNIPLLVNPTSPTFAETLSKDAHAAARALGLELYVLHASTEGDFDTVFSTLAQLRADALVIGGDAFLYSRIEQLAALTVRHAVPTISQYREFAAAGGLMSYGASYTDALRLVGIYAGRILKGDKPADLPIMQSTRVELVLNLKTAKALGLTFPISLLGRADEVIE
jgi:putative tryptophan/tyrosine transport system substrate-binding protein